ncbi:hypothetical protein ACFL9U_02745 [Thermodesulfobacteriota bacterium]
MGIVKESTKNFWAVQGEGASGILRIFNMIHGYLYYTIYDHYVMGASTILRWLAKHPDWQLTKKFYTYVLDRYHCKAMIPEDAKKFIEVNEDVTIPLELAKKVSPFKLSQKIILKNYDHLAFVDCP